MNEIQVTTTNPFAAPVDTMTGEISRPMESATARNEQARAVAEVQAALIVARANPRNRLKAVDNILNDCTRNGLAQRAVYAYAKGGTEITGASIRLAECIAQNWGNIQYGIRELSQQNGVSIALAYAWDVETNVRREVQFQVPLKRDTRKGSYPITDSREIYELVANFGARRLRSCILSLIPGDVVEAAIAQCEVTIKNSADVSKEGIEKLVQTFEQFGVTRQQIEKRIQRRMEAINAVQVLQLRKIYQSLRDEMSTPSDWFDPVEEEKPKQIEASDQKGNAGLKAKLKKQKETQKAEEATVTTATQQQQQPAQQAEVVEGQLV